jgi:hypothetical protein
MVGERPAGRHAPLAQRRRRRCGVPIGRARIAVWGDRVTGPASPTGSAAGDALGLGEDEPQFRQAPAPGRDVQAALAGFSGGPGSETCSRDAGSDASRSAGAPFAREGMPGRTVRRSPWGRSRARNPGDVSKRVNRTVWGAVRSLARDGNSRVLTFGGPLAIVADVSLWIGGVVLAFALLYLPVLDRFAFAPSVSYGVRNVVEAIYLSGVTALTIGFGDVVADTDVLRLVTVAEEPLARR